MIWAWVIFIGFVFAMLALDLGVFHRKSHVVGFKESLGWSAVWITLGLSFSVLVYFAYDRHWFDLGNSMDAVDKVVNTGNLAATKYLTAYVVEKSLSVDNIFVIAMVFSSLAVPARYQHRVLFWGILGALVMRGAMIGLGAVLVQNFHAILYVFGAFLIFTGIKMLVMEEKEEHPENNPDGAVDPEVFPDHAGIPWPALHGQSGQRAVARSCGAGCRIKTRSGGGVRACGQMAAHAACSRADTRGGDGSDFRGRFDSRGVRHHGGSVPRFHQQRLRHPRAALAVFRSGRI